MRLETIYSNPIILPSYKRRKLFSCAKEEGIKKNILHLLCP